MAISVENRKFLPTPCILRPNEEVRLGIGYRRSGSKKKLERRGYRTEKEVLRYLHHLDTIHERLTPFPAERDSASPGVFCYVDILYAKLL